MLLATTLCLLATRAQGLRQDPVIGSWDLNIKVRNHIYPGWLEVHPSGINTLVGRFMAGFGSARPVAEVVSDETGIHFAIPTQWEAKTGTLRFDGHVLAGKLDGALSGDAFKGATVTGTRAPEFPPADGPISWDRPHRLIGKTLESDWNPAKGWVLQKGLLSNKDPHTDIVTKEAFKDFKLHAEFRYPKESNSGIYLRGRYEVQILDSYGVPIDDEQMGAVYGLLIPRVNACKPAGEWQSIDITLIGRTVSVILNGIKIIENQNIPGPTGGAIDTNESTPGPLKLQGDHGQIDFRNIILWPRK